MAKWRLRLFWALLFGLSTAWLVTHYLNSYRDTVTVVVAARDIPARTEITPGMVTAITVSRADQQGLAAFSFQTVDQVVGRNARRLIEKGEVLRDRPGDLTQPGDVRPGGRPGEGALADFLPGATRAVTLALDRQAVLGQQVRPGDRVDVVFTSKSDSTGGVYASLILQQASVLDIQEPPADEPDKETMVTLLVTPEQAVDLALAKRTGALDLVLTPPDAGSPVPPVVTSPLKFSGQAAQAAKGGTK